MNSMRHEPGQCRESGRRLEQDRNKPGVVQRAAKTTNHPLSPCHDATMQRFPEARQVGRPQRFAGEEQVREGASRCECMPDPFSRERFHISGDIPHQHDTVPRDAPRAMGEEPRPAPLRGLDGARRVDTRVLKDAPHHGPRSAPSSQRIGTEGRRQIHTGWRG